MAMRMGFKDLSFLDIGNGFSIVGPDSDKNFLHVGPKLAKLIDNLFARNSIQIVADPSCLIL